MDRPNVLLVVWDACRYDYAVEHADTLTSIGEENLWFDRAIAPSPWSLPSHASIVTGEQPANHHSRRMGDSVETPLIQTLSERGYSCYGVSANGFASQRTGFHEHFDEFRYTGGRDLYADGMDVSGFAQNLLRDPDSTHADVLKKALRQIPTHDHPVKSATNLLSVSLGELATTHELLQRLPSRTFAPTSDYRYTPETNTAVLQDLLANHRDGPFFAFTNYMDTHRPYVADTARQIEHVGRSLSYRELVRLNENVAHPWEFEVAKESNALNEADLETVRGLYAGAVETVDEHLGRLRDILEREGHLEDTLIVVTSDHGENLGEGDERGRRRMGHEASMSEALLRVPLLLANPAFDGRRIDEPVSLTSLYDLFTEGLESLFESGGEDVSPLVDADESVPSQYPATGGEELYEKYPDLPRDTLRRRVSEHVAARYADQWKVVAETSGDSWATDQTSEWDYDDAPAHLRERCETDLEALIDGDEEAQLSDADVAQLEALGYL